MSGQACSRPEYAAFLGDSALADLIAEFDWQSTALGAIETWPQSLKTAAAIMLRSPVPMVMLWGEAGYMLYNDPYSVFAGGRHPQLLGSKVREGWPEVADFNDNVMKVGLAGGTLSYKDQELTLYRHGHPEQVFMNLDYSPVIDEAGKPGGVLCVLAETTERLRAERALAEDSKTLETINQTGAAVAGELNLERVVQMVTDAGVTLTGAEFGAFFYNVVDANGESYTLYTISGVPRSMFENFPMPRNTKVFAPTFGGEGVVRSDDITKDPRYGQNAPYYGKPKGHLPVVSYLAVPVLSRDGKVLGGLFFGHSQPSQFVERHETLMNGIAAQAAVAIDNARLYQAVQNANESLELRVNQALQERLRDQDRLIETEDALRQSQKMEAVGQLVSGLAHDFNNVLGAVIASLDMIRRRSGDRERIERFAAAGMQAAERGGKLTAQLLAFSRNQRLELRPIFVCDVIESIEELLARTLGPMINITFGLNPAPVPVMADATQTEMMILNLALNARDAMPEGGDLFIGTAVREIDADPEMASGEYVELIVRDSGTGMDADTVRRAIDPFFTTKPVGKGTGLGLPQVYGSARQAGGTVRIESELGRGTTVRVFFPRTDQPATPPMPRTMADRARGAGAGRILLIDDDEDLRSVVSGALETLGYDVTDVGDGPSGLKALESETPDVLVVDFAMPGMNGAEVAQMARKRCPGLPVVLATGYADDAAIERAIGKDATLIRKPFRIDELLDAVEKVCAAETAGAG